MKNPIITVFAFALFLLLAGCGGKREPAKEESASESPSSLMEEAPPYDPSRIDPDAPVVEIDLRAIGNNMTEMAYDQKELRVREGTTVKLRLHNDGTDETMIHNFILIQEGKADVVAKEALNAGLEKDYLPSMKEVLVGTKLAKPKQQVEIIFPAPAKGVYDFICTYPGHYQIMNGTFIVE